MEWECGFSENTISNYLFLKFNFKTWFWKLPLFIVSSKCLLRIDISSHYIDNNTTNIYTSKYKIFIFCCTSLLEQNLGHKNEKVSIFNTYPLL